MSPIKAFFTEYPSIALQTGDNIPDTEDDRPLLDSARSVTPLGPLNISRLVFGAASLSHHYNDQATLQSDVPYRVVRLALRYGISSFDTSPYYGASEIILGQVLRALSSQFPRTFYKLMSKCGRYGPTQDDFDYSPSTIRQSILRSLTRLDTDYLDVAYLHDVEFVASPVHPDPKTGYYFAEALGNDDVAWGLGADQADVVHGGGDQAILSGISELFRLKEEGKVKAVGISGYSLPTLLRLAILIAERIKPLDAVLSFCHLTLQNSILYDFLPAFKSRGIVGQVINASPLSMGLLTETPPPWHPSPPEMKAISTEAAALCKARNTTLPKIALRYALKPGTTMTTSYDLPTVIGLSNLSEVHALISAAREAEVVQSASLEEEVQKLFAEASYQGWSWITP